MGNSISRAEQLAITRIQVTNVVAGLRRVPVGFYVSVHHGGAEWRTMNKPVSLDANNVIWNDKIILPDNVATNLTFKVVASFELAPILGNGVLLREFGISLEDLIDRSSKTLPITFTTQEGDPVLSCPSVSIMVERGHFQGQSFAQVFRQHTLDPAIRSLANVTDEGHNALLSYERTQNKQDLELSIERFTHALEACPSRSPYFPPVLCNLAMAKLVSYQADSPNVDTDLDASITLLKDALNFRPVGHPDRPATLLHLSIALLTRFNQHHFQTDVDEADRLLSQLLELCPSQSYEHRSALNVRSVFAVDVHTTLVTHTGHDLRDSIQAYDPDRAEDIGTVALSHLERFKELGETTDLTAAITCLQEVVQSTKAGGPNRLFWLMNLAMSYSMRFEHLQDVSDLGMSISTLEDLVELSPDDNTRAGLGNNLGFLLRRRFEIFGDLTDITKSVSVLEEAVRLTPDDRPNRLDSLAISLRTRFDHLGDVADIQKSISLVEDAIQLIPDGHPHKTRAFCTLATSLLSRFERLGDMPDLDRSIDLFEQGIGLTPDGHPDKATRLNNFGGSLARRFQCRGNLADLDKSVSVFEDAVGLTPDGHPDKPGRVAGLGHILSIRFNRRGNPVDIYKSISLLENAVRLVDNDLEKVAYMSNLSIALIERFDRLGDVVDVDGAVSLCEDAASLLPKSHLARRICLEGLSHALTRRYDYLADPQDLQRAIAAEEDAIGLTPDGHPSKPPMLSAMGALLMNLFDLREDRTDIDRAVSLPEEACSLVPDDHPEKPALLSNLGTAYSKRFGHAGEHADVEHAISRYEDAHRLLPHGHPYKAGFLNNLSKPLTYRFLQLNDRLDIDKSISLMEESIRLTPESHPSWSARQKDLGESFLLRYTLFEESADLDRALSTSSLAALSSTGPPNLRFGAARVWIAAAHMLSRDTLDAYNAAIDLLPQLAWIGLPLKDRHHALLQANDIARDAAAVVLELCRIQTAVEWLEHGRSVVWRQFLQLRNPLDELREVHPTLADRLHRVSNDLEKASARDPPGGFGQKGDLGPSLDREAQRHRALAKERDTLLADVRSLPGFERFLLPKAFDQLTAAAHSGPIIILNASQWRCDAVVVRENPDDLVHVPLPDMTFARAGALEKMLSRVLADSGREISDTDRGARLATQRNPQDVFKQILSELWRDVVKPVLDKLGYKTPGGLHRVFWYPTGPFAFLPIHAAGLYDGREPEVKASDFVISSYTPMLGALMLPSNPPSSDSLRIVAVPQPESDGQVRLPGARKEIDQVESLIETWTTSFTTVSLVKNTGTVDDVLDKMKDSNWVHFACHGVQDTLNPLDSGLMLADKRRLKLSDIIKLSRPRGGLAFLSACQTARGDKDLSEEAIHLAAGMLLAGYSSVIATMWSIGDSDAPEVAKRVYEQLFGDGEVPDATQAARALHHAVEHLRQRGAPFISWVPFIHVGL